MLNQLSGLLSDKMRKPIIINGKLVTEGNAVIMLRREKYRVIAIKVMPGQVEEVIENGDELLVSLVNDFTQKYGSLFNNGGKQPAEDINYFANVDTFTGAIVLKNELYVRMLDENNEFKFHDTTFQLKSPVQAVVDEFIKEFTLNYFEIYSYLLNRRLMASHMPVKIKGHLVAGLYQPLVVGTKHIDCPLRLGEFSWFFDYLNTPSPCEKQLESVYETSRGLELTAVAMCDFAQKFYAPCAQNLNRLYFQFILYSILLDFWRDGSASLMVKRFRRIWRSMENGRGDAANTMQFFAACIEGFRKSRSTLVVRS